MVKVADEWLKYRTFLHFCIFALPKRQCYIFDKLKKFNGVVSETCLTFRKQILCFCVKRVSL